MAIADELKTLQDLHEKGTLTDSEYSAAKATTLGAEVQQRGPSKTDHSLSKGFVRLLFLSLVILGLIWYRTGTKQTAQLLATAVHAPIQLLSEVQNVPANSWKAIPFTTTYSGTVEINLRVVRGNPMDVLVVDTTQLEHIKAADSKDVLSYTDFNAQKTQLYDRTGQLQQGTYYLVLRDTSLGILSSSASDISIAIQLKP